VRAAEPKLNVSPPYVPMPAAVPKPPVPAPSRSKPLLRSRTLWLNAMTLIAAAPLLAGDTLDLAHRTGLHIPPEVTRWALFVLGLLNIILRLRTTQPVKCGKELPCPPNDAPIGRPPVPGIRMKQQRQTVVGR
jgi:hypothetical protein